MYSLLTYMIFSQKAKYISDRLVAVIKSRMRRGSYRVDDEESLETGCSTRGQKCNICSANLEQEQFVIKVEMKTKKARGVALSNKIDLTSRYLFTISFLLFNVFYWLAYVYDIRFLPENARDI